ncbi:muscarinic acetylcholine receptor M3-like isoform X2 [Acanthaster planci]|uniref:Muscarinic acetylcholine receptor M3-like isoform X2 n=1 Tax=Acanthaster planci TaxID=133434 RepID=A0A8B7YJU9_ACAPL|nr:muscarinic acetylcholine receptor M3-like isoform X2 [Acanthaster planci]
MRANLSTEYPTILPEPHQIPPNLIPKVVLCTVFLLATLFGNALVLYAYFTTKKLRTYTNYYIVGLALSDLVSGGILPLLENILWFLGYWPFSEGMCAAVMYLVHVFLEITFLMTLVICFDRFRALYMPLKHLKEKTLRHACFMISLAYVIPLFIWTPLIIIFPYTGLTLRIRPPICQGSYGFHPPLLIIAMLVLSWIPMMITILLYAFVYSAVIRKGINKKRGIGEEVSSDFRSEQPASQRACNRGDGKLREKSYRLNKELASKTETTEQPTDSEQPPPRDEVFSISAGMSAGLNNPAYEHTEEVDYHHSDNTTASKPDVTTAATAATTVGNLRKRRGLSMRSRRSKRERHLANLRATRTLTCILITTVVTAAPWSVFALWGAVYPYTYPLTDNQMRFLAWLAHLSSTVNPICYAVCNPLFKEAFLRILRCQKRSLSRSSTMRSQNSKNGR